MDLQKRNPTVRHSKNNDSVKHMFSSRPVFYSPYSIYHYFYRGCGHLFLRKVKKVAFLSIFLKKSPNLASFLGIAFPAMAINGVPVICIKIIISALAMAPTRTPLSCNADFSGRLKCLSYRINFGPHLMNFDDGLRISKMAQCVATGPALIMKGIPVCGILWSCLSLQ